MITHSDLMEARKHLENALHHAGLALKAYNLGATTEAIRLLEGSLAAVVTAEGNAPKPFDDTQESGQ